MSQEARIAELEHLVVALFREIQRLKGDQTGKVAEQNTLQWRSPNDLAKPASTQARPSPLSK